MKFPLEYGVLKRLPALPAAVAWLRSAMGRHLRHRIIGSLALLLCAALLQACSTVKLAYNQAPDLAYWYLDSYFDFTGAQSLQVKADLTKVMAWHRQNQLPTYVNALQKLQQQMPGDMSAAQACTVYADVRVNLLAVSQQAEPAVVTLVSQLNAAQLTFLERKFAKNDAQYRDDYLDVSPKEARSKRYKQLVTRAEMLYGGLNDAQVAVINKRLDDSSFDARMFYAEKLRRQQDALATLRQLVAKQTAGPALQAAVHGLLERTYTSPDAAHRANSEKLQQDACKTFADLHNSTTGAQRSKAVDVLKGYEQDFSTLNATKL